MNYTYVGVNEFQLIYIQSCSSQVFLVGAHKAAMVISHTSQDFIQEFVADNPCIVDHEHTMHT